MKQIWIGILNQLKSSETPININFLYTTADTKMPYDDSFEEVKTLLCKKIQIIIDNLPDEQ